MKVSGILETALSVADPAGSAAFYKRLFGFDTLLDTDRLVALSVAGRDVLLLFKKGATEEPATLPGGVIPGHGASGRSHLAFSIPAEDLEPWQERPGLRGAGHPRAHPVRRGRQRPAGRRQRQRPAVRRGRERRPTP